MQRAVNCKLQQTDGNSGFETKSDPVFLPAPPGTGSSPLQPTLEDCCNKAAIDCQFYYIRILIK